MKRTQLIIVIILVILFSIGGVQLFRQQKGATMNKPLSTQPSASSKPKGPPPMSIDPTKTYLALLHTDVGDIKIALHAKETPVTVNNFVNLTNAKFYDGTMFHRVIKGFMIQGGDPEGTGRGGPGYQFDDETFTGEYTRGVVAMANAGPNTNGSQFFIMHATYDLPKNYVIFGNVVEGMETVDTIATSDVVDIGTGEQSKPVKPVRIKTAEIIEKSSE